MAAPPPLSRADDDEDSKKVPGFNDDGIEGENGVGVEDESESGSFREGDVERMLVRKIDLRLCTIAGLLASLNLIDSGIISSASVTSIFKDLGLGVGDRYVSSCSLFLCFG